MLYRIFNKDQFGDKEYLEDFEIKEGTRVVLYFSYDLERALVFDSKKISKEKIFEKLKTKILKIEEVPLGCNTEDLEQALMNKEEKHCMKNVLKEILINLKEINKKL